MPNDRSYLLGTNDSEVERLGLQHQVWKPRVLEAWRRAGITRGSSVLDAGAGPGWATFDLADMVGPEGIVHAAERSGRFLEFLEAAAEARGLPNIRRHELDLVADPLPVHALDAVWVRWVLAFVTDPASVLQKLSDALRPGGRIVIHEYLLYETFAVLPDAPEIEMFKAFVVEDWRKTGAEPNIGRALPAMLPNAGLRPISLKPIVEVLSRDDVMWWWPTTWGRNYPRHLVESGKVDADWASAVTDVIDRAQTDPTGLMITPMVLEIIAEKI